MSGLDPGPGLGHVVMDAEAPGGEPLQVRLPERPVAGSSGHERCVPTPPLSHPVADGSDDSRGGCFTTSWCRGHWHQVSKPVRLNSATKMASVPESAANVCAVTSRGKAATIGDDAGSPPLPVP